MKVFATYNLKGGVGKTTAAVNLSHLSVRDGARSLVWDLDPQGAATFYFRIKPKVKGGGRSLIFQKSDIARAIKGTDFEGLHLLPADFSYRHLDLFLDQSPKPKKRLSRLLKHLDQEYDYVFLDCAPSLSLVSESVFRAADALIVPTIPTTLSVRSLDQLSKGLEPVKRRPRVMPFFSMVDRRRALHRRICDQEAAGPFRMLSSRIPSSSLIEQMGIHRLPLQAFAFGSEAARAFRVLWSEIRLLTCRPDNHGMEVPR